MHYARRAAGTLFLLAIGVSGLVTLPGGGQAVREDGLETIVLAPPPGAQRVVAAETADEPAEPGAPPPAFLLIPSLGVSAVVEQAGLTPDRQMENPTDWDKVAWYKYGSVPGGEGSAVLAGHLDSETGTAVFWDLEELQPGDEVEIIDTRGDVRTFAVTGSELYDATDVPMEEIFAAGGKPRIALITCDGAWSAGGGYSKRLVVYAEITE